VQKSSSSPTCLSLLAFFPFPQKKKKTTQPLPWQSQTPLPSKVSTCLLIQALLIEAFGSRLSHLHSRRRSLARKITKMSEDK